MRHYLKWHSQDVLTWSEKIITDVWNLSRKGLFAAINIENFMKSARLMHLHTSWWSIRNRTSEQSERVEISDTNQRVRKYRTKHFPCGMVFIIYVLILSLKSLNAQLNEPFMRKYSTVQASYFLKQRKTVLKSLYRSSSFVFASKSFFFCSFCFDCSYQLKRITCKILVQFFGSCCALPLVTFFACQKYSSHALASTLLWSFGMS